MRWVTRRTDAVSRHFEIAGYYRSAAEQVQAYQRMGLCRLCLHADWSVRIAPKCTGQHVIHYLALSIPGGIVRHLLLLAQLGANEAACSGGVMFHRYYFFLSAGLGASLILSV
jgi:hypothetical protein